MGKAISVNIERCLACRSCEIACALVHSESKVLEGAVAECPRPRSRVKVEGAGEFAVPMQCRHCEDAPCVTVCPTSAIHRHNQNDPVLIDAAKCIGCNYCLTVCPFGVIDVSADGKAVAKCDLCIERTKAGEEPACVIGCPTGALKFEEVAAMLSNRRKEAAEKAGKAVAESDE